jgi:hypothetical protein
LQKVSLPVLSNDECKKQSYFENLNIDYGQICVGGIEGKGKAKKKAIYTKIP